MVTKDIPSDCIAAGVPASRSKPGMNISKMSELLYAYTAGYPFLVSRICQLMDERVRDEYENLKLVWTENGFNEAVRILLAEKNPLFESLVGKYAIIRS